MVTRTTHKTHPEMVSSLVSEYARSRAHTAARSSRPVALDKGNFFGKSRERVVRRELGLFDVYYGGSVPRAVRGGREGRRGNRKGEWVLRLAMRQTFLIFYKSIPNEISRGGGGRQLRRDPFLSFGSHQGISSFRTFAPYVRPRGERERERACTFLSRDHPIRMFSDRTMARNVSTLNQSMAGT